MLLTANETPKMGIYYIPVSSTDRSSDENRSSKGALFLNWTYGGTLGLHAAVSITHCGSLCFLEPFKCVL